MKKIVLLITLLASLSFGQSMENFAKKFSYETNYEKALERAKAEKKDILMLMVTNYCPWCRKLEKRVFSSDKINSLVQKKYIPLIVNREEKKHLARFNTPIVPVTYRISYKDDTKFTKTLGYQSKNDMYQILQKN